jgi:hypothetical protein
VVLATVLTVADMVHLEMQLMMVQAPKLKRWTKTYNLPNEI